MSQFDKKRAIVFGIDAIGRGIALRLGREGVAVALIDADIDEAEATARDIRRAGGRAVSSGVAWDAVRGAIEHAVDRLGGLDILVNNVLPQPHIGPLEEQPPTAFETTFGRVHAAAAAMQAALPPMRAAGGGRIINVGHRYGETVNDGIAAYNAAAWGLVGLTRTAAVDWGKYQIATNLLLPLADTPEFRVFHQRRSKLLDLMVGQLPLCRLGDTVEDIGATVLFLASEACNFVNGTVIYGDGGQHTAGPVLNPGKLSLTAQ
ncbi:SDR family oxidoreductase [Paraburkholderia sp. JPY303]|uniref:SDR family NAD(P)-dependent oxidoreductase n=1 Tax=Paraburkholderia atlantica TaxID=2654982 RepID=UPI0007C5B441|nr:SDR family oxidoreductase [Paraburkholderia atlantica]MBB5414724.1 NAD(P)-dependent dehydrogenase (short-subunit alcohol dehydrogenase family) [Paraburkholderia atlantica]NUY29233.1 SDR family oxidoreductase [Paraburkholderia atlantica]